MLLKNVPIGQKVKVYFKENDRRFPMIGIFVRLADFDQLSSKGMVRFVNQSKLDYWSDAQPVGLTKIYVANDFLSLKPVG